MTKPSLKSERGLHRVINASRYSFAGLSIAWRKEAAFQQELTLSILAIFLIFALNLAAVEKALLWASTLLVLVVELINLAVEATVDRIGEEYHPLSGSAKDLGSAAGMTILLLMADVWLCILI